MITLEKTAVFGWESAIRGMRNPLNSWHLSDSTFDGEVKIGKNDHSLMMRLAKGRSSDSKYRRAIFVAVDITAPLYWWKEFDTYKIGTVSNSCSTMHKIHANEFTRADFSCEKMSDDALAVLDSTIAFIEKERVRYNETKDKGAWHNMIQLLPASYNQKRTIHFNYEVLASIYPDRKYHKLDEWHKVCDWIKTLPYSEFITGEMPNER